MKEKKENCPAHFTWIPMRKNKKKGKNRRMSRWRKTGIDGAAVWLLIMDYSKSLQNSTENMATE